MDWDLGRAGRKGWENLKHCRPSISLCLIHLFCTTYSCFTIKPPVTSSLHRHTTDLKTEHRIWIMMEFVFNKSTWALWRQQLIKNNQDTKRGHQHYTKNPSTTDMKTECVEYRVSMSQNNSDVNSSMNTTHQVQESYIWKGHTDKS